MGGFTEYDDYDALGLAELIRKREVSAAELLSEAMDRVERVNPDINAVISKMYDQAKAAIDAGLPDGPFTGVPFLLKDLYALFAGAVTTNGSRFFVDNLPDHDTELVSRYKSGGFVIFGKTNTPEFGLNVSTEPRLFGPTRNPWDREFIAGGSSGGAAAAVASGILPAAHASDGGGSIRIPASCCGLFGLKPTRGRNPAGPDRGEGWSGMSVEHVVSRTVRDSAAILDLTCGPDLGAPYWAMPPVRPFLDEVGANLKELRVAYSTQALSGVPVDRDCITAVEDAVKIVESFGCRVEESMPKISAEGFADAFQVIAGANTMAAIEQYAALTGREVSPNEFENISWLFAQIGANATATAYAGAIRKVHQVGREVARFFVDYDLFVTPTLAKPPQPLGVLDMMSTDPEQYSEKLFGFAAFTALFNASGNPAMSVPLHWTAGGLPVGVHFVGRYGEESTLFRLAAMLEQAKPWGDRKPTVYA